MCSRLSTLALGAALLTPTLALGAEPPVVLADLGLARLRVEHSAQARAVLRNRSGETPSGRVRLVATLEDGSQRESEWAAFDAMPRGRWRTHVLTARECPVYTAWQIELEVGALRYRYTGQDPRDPPTLVWTSPEPEATDPETPVETPTPLRVGVHAGWDEGRLETADGRESKAFLVRVHIPGDDDPESLQGKLTLVAHQEGQRAGRSRVTVNTRVLRRDATRVDWTRVKAGTAAWDADARCLVVAMLRAEYPEELDLRLDVTFDVKGRGEFAFPGLAPPYRNDPVPASSD